jgi:phytoene dehydrogenase-like protein
VATLADKIRVARFRRNTTRGDLAEIYERPEQTTLGLLRTRGFSEVVIERFFRPFLGGVFLDHQLQTSSRMCEFVFRMFSLGDATLPKQGMNAIPEQLASRLPAGVVRTSTPVDAIDGRDVVLASGQRLSARAVVIATEAPTARRLLGDPYPADGNPVTCLYFTADDAPIDEPILVLNGEGEGPINNLSVPSQVSPAYAPAGKSLISVTVLGEQVDPTALREQVVRQLQAWFGSQVQQWQHLKTYQIQYALPVQSPPALDPVAKPSRAREGVFVCGDHCDTASINGAMISGQRAAEAVAASL